MIQQGYQMDFTNQNFGVILYGAPGIGKTTAALSDGANGANTLVLDLERGIGRTKPVHRMSASVLTADKYEDVLDGLNSPEASAAQTIVIDTCGALVDFLKDWAMRTKTDAKLKSGAFNGMKGFGYVKTEIESLTNRIKNVMHKNVVYIFHADEKADKDGNPVQRLRCEGSFRNTVWTGIDFGGYIQMIGPNRVVCFSPTEEYFAKGCHGIEGNVQLPTLKPGQSNSFLANLFATARANMKAEQDELAPQMAAYEETMGLVRDIIGEIKDEESATQAATVIPTLKHALTSKAEASAMLKDKTTALGLKWNKDAKAYVKAGDPQ
ncbi:MAG: AAA family ATPase [Clostridia bacterium]|nr:AAA family ATPase [Clostridia bacterium]